MEPPRRHSVVSSTWWPAVPDAATSLVAMLRAEAGKIVVIVGGLWLVLSTYKDIVPAAFFTTFVITVIVFSMAFFVRD